MRLSRREFLKISAASAGLAGMAVGFGYWQKTQVLVLAKGVYRKMANPGLRDSLSGPLPAETLKTLMATTEALVASPVEPTHYQDFFNWRAANVPGYLDLYKGFSSTVNRVAEKINRRNFADHDPASRRKILVEMMTNNQRGKLGRAFRGVFDRNTVLFEPYVIEEILALFNATDAWVLLGYSTWPGTPRGLENYRKAPTNLGSQRAI